MGIIYLATNKQNGKIYIGQTSVGLKERQRTHICDMKKGKNTPFCNALRKYDGIEGFDWKIIHDGVETIEELNELEVNYIARYGSMVGDDKGYNADSGGKNKKPSEETRKKISASRMGIVPWNKGIPRTVEEKAKMSKSHLGKKQSVETIEKKKIIFAGEGNSFYGKEHTDQAKSKIAEKNSKWFKITKPNGKIEIIKNLNQYCKDNGLHHSAMYSVMSGKSKSPQKLPL